MQKKSQNMSNEMVARIITPIWYLPCSLSGPGEKNSSTRPFTGKRESEKIKSFCVHCLVMRRRYFRVNNLHEKRKV